MEGLIPGPRISQFKSQIREGSVYSIERFNLYDPKRTYRAVDHPIRICFTPGTVVREVAHPPDNFPVFAYTALPFSVLAERSDSNVQLSGMFTYTFCYCYYYVFCFRCYFRMR
jgi:hypothetical protein